MSKITLGTSKWDLYIFGLYIINLNFLIDLLQCNKIELKVFITITSSKHNFLLVFAKFNSRSLIEQMKRVKNLLNGSVAGFTS